MEFSNALKAYIRKRDAATEGLNKCEPMKLPEELEQLGYELIDSEFFGEGKEQHRFLVYQKEKHMAVYTEVYVEKEGGLYYQNLFTSDGKAPA